MNERRRLQIVIRDILEYTYPAGNGGYVAQFGPVTYARLVEFVGEQPEQWTISTADLNDGSPGGSDG